MTSPDAPPSLWPEVAAFVGWGVLLSLVQWAVERSAVVLWATGRLAAGLGYGLGFIGSMPTRVDGRVVTLFGATQEITPNCFGFAALTFLGAALLATPAGWRDRVGGLWFGLQAIVVANILRLCILAWFFAYAFFAFSFLHIPVWGTVVPLFLTGLWGVWVSRDLHYFPVIPLRFVGLVAMFMILLLVGWYQLLDRYVVALVYAVNALLTTLGVPIATARLTATDLLRLLDLGLPSGGVRIEVAAQTLNVVPFLALALASPIALGRRLLLGVCGLAVLFVLQCASVSALILLGWSARPLVPVFEVVNDFVTLAAGPSLWLLLVGPPAAWFAEPAGERPSAHPASATAAAGPARRR